MDRTGLTGRDFSQQCFKKALDILIRSKKVLIWGDEDPDGITAVSIMKTAFDEAGIPNIYYVPSRKSDGIGLNASKLKSLSKKKYDTVITVDCGIVNSTEIRSLIKKKINVIITDHHIPYRKLERGAVYIDTHMLANRKFRHLSGAGLSAVFSLYILSEARKTEIDELDSSKVERIFSLASLGTLCDRVEIKGYNRKIMELSSPVNRIFPSFYKFSGNGELCGIISSSKTDGAENPAVDIFTGKIRGKRAERIVKKLKRERDDYSSKAGKWHSNLRKKTDPGKNLIILRDLRMDSKYSGMAASRISEELKKPVLIIARRGAGYSGEARSSIRFNWIKVFKKYSGMFTSWGGHRQAAGFSIKKEKIDAFIGLLDDDYNC